MAGVVLITPDDMKRIKEIVAEARKEYIPWEKLKDIAVLTDKPTLELHERKPGARPKPSHNIQLGNHRAALSYEEQPAGMCKHLSVSLGDGTKLPHPLAVGMIAEEFGFPKQYLEECMVWVEEFEPGKHAINLVFVSEPKK